MTALMIISIVFGSVLLFFVNLVLMILLGQKKICNDGYENEES